MKHGQRAKPTMHREVPDLLRTPRQTPPVTSWEIFAPRARYITSGQIIEKNTGDLTGLQAHTVAQARHLHDRHAAGCRGVPLRGRGIFRPWGIWGNVTLAR